MAQSKLSKDFKVTPSTPYAVTDAGSKLYFPLEEGKTISIKTRGEVATIQRFDTRTMKEISRKEYKDLPKYTKVQKVLQIRGKLFYIYEAYNKKSKEKSFTLYIREIDTNTGTFKPEKKLFTTSGPILGQPFSWGTISTGMFGWGGAPKFDISTSFDDSKILVRFRHKPTKKSDAKSNDKIGFYVYDQNFEKVWAADVRMPYTEKEMNNLAYMVKSNGTATMLIYKTESKSFELLTLKEGGDKMSINKLAIKKDLLFAKFDLREDVNGNIAAAGFYANGIEFKWSWGGGSTSFNCNGLYSFTTTDEGEILTSYDHEFPLEFIQQYVNKRERNKAQKREKQGKAGMEEVKMTKFFTQEDGSSIILAEQWYVRKELVGTNTQNVWHYRHMIAMKIDAEGKLVWMKKLPKNQAGLAGQGQMSFKYVPGDGCHYLLYVGNPKNADLPVDQVPAAHKDGMGGFLTAYKVDDETGKVEKHTILDMVKVDGSKMRAHQFNVKRIFEAEDKVFLLEIYIKGKKDAMIKMELK
jgi:hypothetical protein